MWSPSLRAPPLWAGACFLSFVSAFCLPPRRRRYAPSPVGGCVLPVLFRGCHLRRRCPFSLVRPPLWRRCSALCVRALSVPHATSRAFRCAALAARAPLSLPQSELGAADLRVCAVRAARSLRASKNIASSLMRRWAARGFQFLECPSLFAPLALSRCGRLARRVFPRCKEAFSASDRNTTRNSTFSICAVCQGRAALAVASQTLTAALNCAFGYYGRWC